MSKKLIEIPPNAVMEIRKSYNLDGPGRMEEAIDILEKWIKQEKHILKKDFKREYLEWTLISGKGSVEKAKTRIDALCTMRTLIPHFFAINNTKAEFQEVLKLINVALLPKPTKDLYRILVLKYKNGVYTQALVSLFLKYGVFIAEYLCYYEYVKGFILVDDFSEVNLFDLVTKMNSVHVQQCMSIIMKGYGARINAINIVSQSKAVELFTNLIRQFVSTKIANRIRVYKNMEDLLNQDLPKEHFPKEFGGKERSLDSLTNDLFEAIFSEESMDHLKLMSTACTDERLRSSEKFNTTYMGMPGSFRNLSVD